MGDPELLASYNYDEFIPEKFMRWLNLTASPLLGEPSPDFPLWNLDARATSLSATWSRYTYLIVEFGSFT
jgi:hypothetical protein